MSARLLGELPFFGSLIAYGATRMISKIRVTTRRMRVIVMMMKTMRTMSTMMMMTMSLALFPYCLA
jgi:hypothetical protein